ncbi:MAG: tetratricopeptide repeat protein [Synechococcales cyanobacterium RM1_1_8]|nr:tetratricopeptide repeat protein [Synechococcales cyanobacterium RM1_1_8]
MYSESLKIRQDTNDSYGEAITLNNIGLLLRKTGDISQGIEKLQSSLAIFRRIGDPVNEGNTLDSLGSLYKDKGSFLEAERAYQQALILLRDSGSYPIERVVLQNLGVLFEDKRSLDLAISFYKQSINLTEDIRKDLRSLPLDAQSSYTRKVSDTYRRLADLLIKKGRIGEAQQVLELLKIQEINDITEGTRSATPTAQIALSQLEQDIIAQYNSLIDFGQKLADCEQTRCDKLGEYQTQYTALTQAYDRFLEDTKTNLTAARATEIDAGTKTFLANADRIITAQPNTALIYPLVLEDKVRILWATKGGALNQAECPLGEAELSGLVETFRTALQTTSTATPVQQAGKKLYDCLIPPKLQAVLNNSRIDNLIFVPDRITNYIPMAALHDGQQYLIERYSLSNILAASFTDTDSRLPSEPSILGFGSPKPSPSTIPPAPTAPSPSSPKNSTPSSNATAATTNAASSPAKSC